MDNTVMRRRKLKKKKKKKRVNDISVGFENDLPALPEDLNEDNNVTKDKRLVSNQVLNNKINPKFGVSSDLNIKYSAAAISSKQSRSGSGTSGTSGTSSGDTSSHTETNSKSLISAKKPAPSSKYEIPMDDSPPAIIDNYEDDFG